MDSAKSHGGVVRRSRDVEVTSSDSGKRRKLDHQDDDQENVVQLQNHYLCGVDLNSPEDFVSTAESGSCDNVSSTSCFKNDLSLDLKVVVRFETENSMPSNGVFSRETSASSEICLDSDEMESSSILKRKPVPPAATSRQKPATTSNTPTAAEIEEFFAVAEKKEQKRFADKYNFDIVNDVPMDGRYQWVRLKP